MRDGEGRFERRNRYLLSILNTSCYSIYIVMRFLPSLNPLLNHPYEILNP